jgi:hypothetical protein
VTERIVEMIIARIGVRTISRITMKIMIMEIEHHKALVKANPQVKTAKWFQVEIQ